MEGESAEAWAIAVVAAAALLAGGFALLPPHGVFREPHSAAKTLAIVAIALVAAAAPLAVAEGRSDRRYAKEEARLRAEREWALVEPYAGPEGEGERFVAPDGAETLLLRPVGGVGAPRVVRAPPPAAPPPLPSA